VYLTLAMLAFLIGYAKFVNPYYQYQEIFNEFIVFFIAMLYFSIGQHISFGDEIYYNNVGWIMVALTAFCFIVNICFIIGNFVFAVKSFCNKKYNTKKSHREVAVEQNVTQKLERGFGLPFERNPIELPLDRSTN